MAADNGQMSFRRGVMSLVILGLLKKQDMYGYQLVQETERQSGGRIVTQEGSLYPVLYKLVDQGVDFRPEGSGGQAHDASVLPSGTRRGAAAKRTDAGI